MEEGKGKMQRQRSVLSRENTNATGVWQEHEPSLPGRQGSGREGGSLGKEQEKGKGEKLARFFAGNRA